MSQVNREATIKWLQGLNDKALIKIIQVQEYNLRVNAINGRDLREGRLAEDVVKYGSLELRRRKLQKINKCYEEIKRS